MLEVSGDLRIRRRVNPQGSSDVFELEVEFPAEAWTRNAGIPAGLHTRSGIAQLGMQLNPVREPHYDWTNGRVTCYAQPEHWGRHLHGFNPAKPKTSHGPGLRFDVGDRVANLYFMNGALLSRGELDGLLEQRTIDFGRRGCDFEIDEAGRVYFTIGNYMFGLNGGTPNSVRDLESRGPHLILYEGKGQPYFLPQRATITRTSSVVRLGGDLGMLLEREVVGADELEHMRSQYLRPDTDHSIILEIINRSEKMLEPPGLAVVGRVYHVIDHDTSATVHATGKNGDKYQVIKP